LLGTTLSFVKGSLIADRDFCRRTERLAQSVSVQVVELLRHPPLTPALDRGNVRRIADQ
jgi:hypothetical protein